MLLNNLLIITVLFIELRNTTAVATSSSNLITKCRQDEWECGGSGECINNDHLCDGLVQCMDGSDETAAVCLERKCPSFAFRCAYGACISRKLACNGIADCNDGSDETKFLCVWKANGFTRHLQGQCSSELSMQCGSGECVGSERICDGQQDCRDGSDETVELCSFLECPDYGFQCAYGACVSGHAKCNGIKDCIDNSDELPSICQAANEKFYFSGKTTVKPLQLLPSVNDSIPLPPLITHCSTQPLHMGISSIASCFYRNVTISCDYEVPVGSTAIVQCAPGYVMHTERTYVTNIICNSSGLWNYPKCKCRPKCGILSNIQEGSSTQSQRPWDVTIMKRTAFSDRYQPICRAVILSHKVTLSVSSCFSDYNNRYKTINTKLYKIIERIYNYAYREGDPIRYKLHDVSNVYLYYSVATLNKEQGVAVIILQDLFIFMDNLLPICLPPTEYESPVWDGSYNVLSSHNSSDSLNQGRAISIADNRYYLHALHTHTDSQSTNRNSNNSSTTTTTTTQIINENSDYLLIKYFYIYIKRHIKDFDNLL